MSDMKLTPREPTPSMVDAGKKAAHWMTDYVVRVIWRAMHDAAPSAEPVVDEPVGVVQTLGNGVAYGVLNAVLDDGTALYTRPAAQEPASEISRREAELAERAYQHAIDTKTVPVDSAERGEYPPDAVIAQCMLAVDDPLLWGRLGENSGDMVRKFARAVIDADRAQRVPMTNEQIDEIVYANAGYGRDDFRSCARAVERAHGIGAKP